MIETEPIEFIGNAVAQRSHKRSHKSEQVIRAWGFSSPIAKKYIQQADDLLIEYSTKQRVLLGMAEDEAQNTTLLEYAIFVGGQQLFSNMDKKELEQLYLFYCQKLKSNELK